MNYRIFPPQELPEATISLPQSKSVSNRDLIINALTKDAQPLSDLADCNDTDALIRALAADRAQQNGADGCPLEINVGPAGTAMRFLTAYFACREDRLTLLDGDERMRQRPIGPLVDALRRCGADIEYVDAEGFPPLKIRGHRLTGGVVDIDSTVSSQFVSALLMIAPLMGKGLRLNLVGEPASKGYIALTIAEMEKAGIEVDADRDRIIIQPQEYQPCQFKGEKDWTAASYWYEIEACTSGFLTLPGLEGDSRQPDRTCAELFSHLGVTTDFEGEEGTELMGNPDLDGRLTIDMSDNPDLIQSVVVTCALIGIPFKITGIETLRIKETDRIAALEKELDKIGVTITINGNASIEWTGRRHPIVEMPEFDTYGDHRMAMALAPVSIFIPGIIVRDAEVVAKSYPGYWDDLRRAGFTVVDPEEQRPENQSEEEGGE